MDKRAVLEIVGDFRQALAKRGIHADRIVLFGSFARGNPHEGSDIDLIVISEDFAGKGFWERIEVLAEVVCELFKPIEAVAMTPEEWGNESSPLVQFAKQGEVVYQAKSA